MDDLISRKALLEELQQSPWIADIQELQRILERLPAVDAVVLPCKVGDVIYKIQSETNHKLNVLSGKPELNKVYEQRICRIELYENGVFLPVTCDGMCSVHSAFFGVDWFLTREEAEAALKKRKEDDHD